MQQYFKNLQKTASFYLKTFFLYDIFIGMLLTFKYLFKAKITIDYPKQKTKVSSKFRGEHGLRSYEGSQGEKEKCIGCKLCEIVCPAQAIIIETDISEDGSRRTTRYDIDMTKCIYCGLCEESCPVDAIVEGSNMEFSVRFREMLNYNKTKLLKNAQEQKEQLSEKVQNFYNR